MWFRFRFKIHFITAVVLCLGGGIGEISSLVSPFYVNAMYIAVFERQVNKCSPVATTSSPSTYALLRDPLGDPLGAVTIKCWI